MPRGIKVEGKRGANGNRVPTEMRGGDLATRRVVLSRQAPGAGKFREGGGAELTLKGVLHPTAAYALAEMSRTSLQCCPHVGGELDIWPFGKCQRQKKEQAVTPEKPAPQEKGGPETSVHDQTVNDYPKKKGCREERFRPADSRVKKNLFRGGPDRWREVRGRR